MTRPRIGPEQSLRNTRRSLGDGTLGGRSRIATPYDPRRLRRATRALSAGSGTLPKGELLALSATAISIAGAGTSVATSMEVIDAQAGFSTVAAVGDQPRLPIKASYVAEVDVRWTDGYRGGGTIEVTLDGTAIEEVWPTAHTSEPWGRWVDQVTFIGLAAEDFDVKVTPADASSHTADVTVRVAVVEPLRVVEEILPSEGSLYLLDADMWKYDFGSSSWTALGRIESGGGGTWAITSGAVSGTTFHVCRAAGGQLYRSTGTSAPMEDEDWVLAATNEGGNEIFLDVETDGNGVWVAVADNSTAGDKNIWRSTDDGATWAQVTTVTQGGTGDVKHHDGVWTIDGTSAGSGQLHYSTDDGATWTAFDYDALLGWSSYGQPQPYGSSGTPGSIFISEGIKVSAQNVYQYDIADLTTPAHTYSINNQLYGFQATAMTRDGLWIGFNTVRRGRYGTAVPDGGATSENLPTTGGLNHSYQQNRDQFAMVNDKACVIGIETGWDATIVNGIFWTETPTDDTSWARIAPPAGKSGMGGAEIIADPNIVTGG